MQIARLVSLTIDELLSAYERGVTTPNEVIDASLEHIGTVNPRINALYEVQWEAARAAAELSTRRWQKGNPQGALDGIPVTLKDSVNSVGLHWYHGSAAHGSGRVATKDAPPVERLKRAGAIILAKCTMPDFGMSGSGVSSCHGITRNPWNLRFSPGGSSSGGGASLAAGMGMFSIGSDIAGSVRLPASHCGLAAFKPTQGLIAHTPASDVRSAGPITRHAADLEPVLRVLAGVHPDDRFSVPLIEPVHDPLAAKVAVFDDVGFGLDLEQDVRSVLHHAADLLHQMNISVVAGKANYEQETYLAIDDSFKLRAWREYAGADSTLREETPKALVEWCRPASQWSAERVAQFESGISRGVMNTNALFEQADILLTPVMPIVNFAAERLGPDERMPLSHCSFTAPFNQSGHPAVVIHAGMDARGLPIGIQLVGRRFDDIGLLRMATRLEASLRENGLPQNEWPLFPDPLDGSESKDGETRQ